MSVMVKFRRIEIVFAATLLAACSSREPRADAVAEGVKESAKLACSGSGDAGCAIAGGLMLLTTTAMSSYSAADKPYMKKRIVGYCELAEGGKPTPCDHVLLTITARDGSTRRAWIDGAEFDVPNLGPAPWTVTASSERARGEATLNNVKPGEMVRIRFQPGP